MQTLLLGIGNTLRGDDGVGSRVLELLAGKAGGFRLLATRSLLPELALEIARAPRVVFVDADVTALGVKLERLSQEAARAAGHAWSPETLLALARGLGFTGDAWVCRIPVSACGHGEGLSQEAESAAQEAASMLLGTALAGSAGQPALGQAEMAPTPPSTSQAPDTAPPASGTPAAT